MNWYIIWLHDGDNIKAKESEFNEAALNSLDGKDLDSFINIDCSFGLVSMRAGMVSGYFLSTPESRREFNQEKKDAEEEERNKEWKESD